MCVERNVCSFSRIVRHLLIHHTCVFFSAGELEALHQAYDRDSMETNSFDFLLSCRRAGGAAAGVRQGAPCPTVTCGDVGVGLDQECRDLERVSV